MTCRSGCRSSFDYRTLFLCRRRASGHLIRHCQGWLRVRSGCARGAPDRHGCPAGSGGRNTSANPLCHGPGGALGLPGKMDSARIAGSDTGVLGRNRCRHTDVRVYEPGTIASAPWCHRRRVHALSLATVVSQQGNGAKTIRAGNRYWRSSRCGIYKLHRTCRRSANYDVLIATRDKPYAVCGHDRRFLRGRQLRQVIPLCVARAVRCRQPEDLAHTCAARAGRHRYRSLAA